MKIINSLDTNILNFVAVIVLNLLIAFTLVLMFSSSILGLKVLAVFYLLMKLSGYSKKLYFERTIYRRQKWTQ